MHIITILAFACLFWQAEEPGRWVLVAEQDIAATLTSVLLLPAVTGGAALLAVRRAGRLLERHPEAPHGAQLFHHRAAAVLRFAALVWFAGVVFFTRWAEWLAWGRISPALQIVGDAIVLLPFFAAQIALWVAAFPLERGMHADAFGEGPVPGPPAGTRLRLSRFLDFHVRHYLLVVAGPMSVVLFAANMTRGYEDQLQGWSGWVWMPDALLAAAAGLVFLAAPLMLRRIWRTTPLGAGALRQRLEAICERAGLRCRDILVWDSDGLMINAAVMGLLPRLRYVLLSDALLATMNAEQIEAVFGHEVGHVRHRHIQHFLVFAFVGWLLVAGIMELLSRLAGGDDAGSGASVLAIQGVGVAASVAFWGIGFGHLSRRFERQADLFGAQCVTPATGACRAPCGVHLPGGTTQGGPARVCMTGAEVFASALDRVAILNGIPHEERSWRHSSIGSRIRFLMSLAGDPRRAADFLRGIQRIKTAMLAVALVGACLSGYYWLAFAPHGTG